MKGEVVFVGGYQRKKKNKRNLLQTQPVRIWLKCEASVLLMVLVYGSARR
jgi:shikimate kinase